MFASQRFEWPRPIWGSMTLSASCALLLHSILYASQWKVLLSGIFVLYGSPVHLISSSFTFLATASSHWMKVTRTIFVPGMDVTLIVLQKHPNTLHNHQDQCTVADNKNVLYRKLWSLNLVCSHNQPCVVCVCTSQFQFRKFRFVLGFQIFWKPSSLFQVIALSSTHMFSTFINLASRVMQSDGLGCTWFPILPHNLNLRPLILCLLISFFF